MLRMIKGGNSSVGITILLAMVLVLIPPVSAAAAVSSVAPEILITEVQTASVSAGQEFVEFYNATDAVIDFADINGTAKRTWKLQYFNSTKLSTAGFDWAVTTPTRTTSLTGKIEPHEFYLLSATDYLPGSTDPDQTYSAHLANDDGAVRLVSVDAVTKAITGHDQAGWRTTATLSSNFTRPHPAQGSLQRQVNAEGQYSDELGVLTGFEGTAHISPKGAWQISDEIEEDVPVEQPDDTPAEGSSESEGETESETMPGDDVEVLPPLPEPPVTLLSPQITELLPNPAAPASDDSDEFVEVYNPNATSLDLDGYTIETGANNTYHFTFGAVALPPNSFIVVTSGISSLSLANSGGHARLLNPAGAVVSQTDDYEDAPEGESWAFVDGVWAWTITPTSAAQNVLSIAPPPTAKALVAKSITSKPKAAARPKVLSASAASAKKPATKAPTKTVANSQLNEQIAETPPPIHPGVLAAAGVLAVAYAAYEYRTDVANRIYQFRRYRAARRAAR